MKKIVLLLFCLCFSSMIWAKDYLLVIDFTDGTDISFALAKRPILSFSDQKLSISVEIQKSEFDLSDVVNFHFKEAPSDIHSPRVDDIYTIIWQDDDHIVISNATPDTLIRLYGIDGTMYSSLVNANEDRIDISLAALPKGIYLLNINNSKSIKINRR